jgi:hypothetical protein
MTRMLPGPPPKSVLQKVAVSNILKELESGAMASIASQLSRAEREAVAAYLGAPGHPAAAAFCGDRAVRIPNSPQAAWNGWSPSATNTRFQSVETAGLTVDESRN